MSTSCAGATTCSNPPAPYCLNGTTLRSYSSPGACSGGFCSYTPVDTTCGNGCQGAACKTKSGPCGPSNCSGCCTTGGQCDSGGSSVSACGTGGQACAACQTGALCSSHKCSGMRICAAGDQLSCIGSTSKSWNGSQCCVDGAYQCVDGTSLDCATGSTDRQWTGQQCCLQFQALCTTGTSLSCSTGSTIKMDGLDVLRDWWHFMQPILDRLRGRSHGPGMDWGTVLFHPVSSGRLLDEVLGEGAHGTDPLMKVRRSLLTRSFSVMQMPCEPPS